MENESHKNKDKYTINKMSCEKEEGRVYQISSSEKQRFSMNTGQLVSFSVEDAEDDQPKDYITIKGIASSTSVDHYGTEMSFKALKEMASQVKRGVVILPRHESLTGSGLAEWDEVIGRTVGAEVKEATIAQPSLMNNQGFILEVESRLYQDDSRTKALIKRLNRGEPIGQSIGGWFENVRVEEDKEGEIKRVIVEDVTLDHIAITRAPANPDSGGLSVLEIRSSIQSFLDGKKSMDLNTEIQKDPVSGEPIMKELVESKETRDVTATINSNPLPVDPVVGEEKTATGDAEADQAAVPFRAEYEAMKEEFENMKEIYTKMKEELSEEVQKMKEEIEKSKESKLDLYDEDTEEKEDHEEGAIADDEDHIEALEEDEDEDVEDLVEDELKSRTALPFHDDLPLAAEDVPWDWNTTSQDEVLGKGLDNWDRYRDAHLYMNKEGNPESKSAYKLPIARMVNGELRVVLNGVYAAMAALNGARGGVDIPDADRNKVYKNIEKYYDKFGKEVPELSDRSINKEQDSVVILDKTSELNNSSIDTPSESDTRSDKMKPEDIKTLIEQVTRSVVAELKSETAPVASIEEPETTTVDTEAKVRSKAVDAAYGVKEPSIDELKARLERAEETLNRVLEQPLRKGRHTSTSIRGIGQEMELDHLINVTETEGHQSLASVIKRNKNHLLRGSDQVMERTLSNHQLQDVLAKGLRAAHLDGLLGAPVDGWQ